ncbi:recombinase family protein [Rhodococcus sp. IEGM 1302]|uniref:recombinase family protein n=1 Tax=Rhodococcus sp. IEGM 1302 TaxID=3047093 RepID=UPI0024B7EDB2|nr:recombinase family protein [Rhodococcus sp. IEGM 1302]MDI9947413.1 recombinase family protein [Rhodococcus sp. IEGM 1302]
MYARISEDPRGLEYGVSRQREDCEALAAARGWEVVARYSDNDISALKGKERPGYQELMAAADRGEFDQIIAYGLSRLWRSRQERAAAIGALSEARVGVALVKGSDLDLTSAAGRMYAGILGEFDTAESEIKAERVSRAAQQRAEEGRANGACAYGWTREYSRDAQGRVLSWKDVINEDTAEVVRRIVRDLLAGVTIRAIAANLNEAGIEAPLGGMWIPSSVRKLAIRDLNVGIRRHGSNTYSAAWKPIVDVGDHAKVKALLADPKRRTQKAAARTHLLTFGIGKCGVCGGVLAVSRKGSKGKKTSLYVCKDRGCVGRREAWVDELVVSTVCARLSRSDALAIFDTDDVESAAAREAVVGLRARLDGAADAYASGQIDTEQLARITAQLRPRIEEAELQAQPSVAVPTVVNDLIRAADIREAWGSLNISQQRAILDALSFQVVINRARGGPGFKPDSIDITWLGLEPVVD